MSSWSEIAPSQAANNTANPIRGIVDKIMPDPNHPKTFLKLSIGDPTIDGNLLPPECGIKAIQEATASHKYDGYAQSVGYPETRKAIAEFWNNEFNDASRPGKFTEADVIVTSGASHALEMAISVYCNAGDVLLIPAPGFSLYNTICSNKGIEGQTYKCVAAKGWEVDLEGLEKKIQEIKAAGKNLKAMLINNPSNPAGSNFSRAHVTDITNIAKKYHIPLISDEIYAGMTFNNTTFTSVSNFTEVPAIIVGGLAKNWVVPGWRLGWMVKHDCCTNGAFDKIWQGCIALSAIMVGPNTLVQAAVPKILAETKEYRAQLTKTIGEQSTLCYDLLVKAKGLNPIRADGAMYLLVEVETKEFDASWGITDDVTFSQQLMKDQNVQVLPGTIFEIPGFFRIVVTKPPAQLKEAIDRIVEFVAKLKNKKE